MQILTTRPLLAAVLLVGCADPRANPEDPSGWYDGASAQDVEEAIDWTDENYAAPEADADGIAAMAEAVFPVSDTRAIGVGPGDLFDGRADCGTETISELPRTVSGIVTLHPAWYIKVFGCNPSGEGNFDTDSEEKYYSSFFIQDRTGGTFVLLDSRVAPFDLGDRLTIEVRAVKSHYSWDMVYSHDVLEIERDVSPIYYQLPPETPYVDRVSEDYAQDNDICDFDKESSTLGMEQVNEVVRVEGTVLTALDDFGGFTVQGDDGAVFHASLGLDLGRRPALDPQPGQRVQVTGPVMRAFNFDNSCTIFPIAVTRIGQYELLDDAAR
jgi:hypothetical protein